MTVYRVEKNRDYTTMANHHLRDERLSLRAKGLLSMLLGLPDDWEISIRGLSSIVRDGVASVQTGINELIDAGYIVRQRQPGTAERLLHQVLRAVLAVAEAGVGMKIGKLLSHGYRSSYQWHKFSR